jgi:lysophospholipase L1-like esterase
VIPNNARILFQGDSVTDCDRDRRVAAPNLPNGLGKGYVFMIAGQLLAKRPNDGLLVFNRGCKGDRVWHLLERWKQDCIQLKPDVVSIVIGGNDLWDKLEHRYDGTVQDFDQQFHELLSLTRAELPHARLIVGEPFVLRCCIVDDRWFPAFDAYRAVTKRYADGFGALFVPLQSMFDEATRIAPPEFWAPDGIHPSVAGHHLIAQTWLRTAGVV